MFKVGDHVECIAPTCNFCGNSDIVPGDKGIIYNANFKVGGSDVSCVKWSRKIGGGHNGYINGKLLNCFNDRQCFNVHPKFIQKIKEKV